MPAYKNTLEVGSNGSAVTAANSGGANGDAFTFVVLAGGGTITYKDPLPWGGKGIVITTGTSASYPRWDDDASTDTRRIARRPIWLAAELLGTMNVMTIYAGGTAMGALTLVGPGTANVRKAALQNSGFVHQSASQSSYVLELNHLYWAELAVRSTSDPAGPGIEYRILDSDGVTERATYNLAIATNASPPTRVRFGPNTSSVLANDHLDDLRFESKSSGWLGPLAATPPTLVLTGGVRHIIDATGMLLDTTGSSVPVGSIEYTISQITGPVVAPKQLSPGMWAIAPHTTDELTYRVVADGSLGGSDTEDYTVPALLAGTGPQGLRIVERTMVAGVLV